jgi:hypothetical protein
VTQKANPSRAMPNPPDLAADPSLADRDHEYLGDGFGSDGLEHLVSRHAQTGTRRAAGFRFP